MVEEFAKPPLQVKSRDDRFQFCPRF